MTSRRTLAQYGLTYGHYGLVWLGPMASSPPCASAQCRANNNNEPLCSVVTDLLGGVRDGRDRTPLTFAVRSYASNTWWYQCRTSAYRRLVRRLLMADQR